MADAIILLIVTVIIVFAIKSDFRTLSRKKIRMHS